MHDSLVPDADRRGLRFSWEMNLGHLLIVAGMFASVFLAYTDLRSTEAVHEVRIVALERSQADLGTRFEKAQSDNAAQLRDVMREIRDRLDKIQGTLGEKQDRPR